MQSIRPKFWQKHTLEELTTNEWESLCDGCGTCCLVKFVEEDMDALDVEYTDVSCKLLDCSTGWCSNYPERSDYVPDCISLDYKMLSNMMWLPNSYAYKRLHLGLGLPKWHLLLTNDTKATKLGMRQAGVGVAGRCISEVGMSDEMLEDRIITWIDV